MKTVCHHCGHEWDYKGDKQLVTCPSCLNKTNTGTKRTYSYDGYQAVLDKRHRLQIQIDTSEFMDLLQSKYGKKDVNP